MHDDHIKQRRLRIFVIVASIFAVVILWSAVVLISRSGKVGLYISTAPSNATVKIGDSQYGRGTQWLAPGTYPVEATRDGFETVTRTIIVSSDKEQNVLAISLVPKSEDAKKWAEQHQDEYKRNEQYGAIEAAQTGKYLAKSAPITTKLPFKDPYFTIGYTIDEKQTVTLTIKTPSPRYRFYAIEKIREFGYDPTDFRVEFTDFKNPLENTEKNDAA